MCADGDNAKEAADFAVEFEHRSSDKLKRADVIDIVAKAVPTPPYKVSLSNPARTILVQLVRNVAAISVVKQFKQMAKFNLRRLTEEEEESGQAAAAAPTADRAAADAAAPASAEAATEAAEEAAPALAAKDEVATAEAAAEAEDKAES
jgi:tRNA acetyltransferase TAN1